MTVLGNDGTATLARRIERLSASDVVAYDTETGAPSELVARDAKAAVKPYAGAYCTGISVCVDDHTYYIPVGHRRGNIDREPLRALLTALGRTFATHILAHATFDFAVLDGLDAGYAVPDHRQLIDVQVLRWLQDENAKKALKVMGEQLFGLDASEEQRALKAALAAPYRNQTEALKAVRAAYPELSVKEAKPFARQLARKRDWGDLTVEEIAPYAEQDAALTLQVWQELRNVPHHEGAFDREMELQPILFGMTKRGVAADPDVLRDAATLYAKREDEVRQGLQAEFGCVLGTKDFNPGSSKQVARLLFEELGLPVHLTTPGGDPSTGKEALEMLQGHPVAARVLEYRHWQKARTAYCEPLLDYLDRSPDGRIHGMFDSTGTVTGRLSCSNPNLMTIPKPDSLPEVRKAFYLANEPGHERLGFDLASAELWVTASITGDPTLTAILQEGRDMHTEMAMLAFGQAEGRWRTLAKNVNYGMAYGAGVAQLSLYAAKAGLDPEAARRAAFKVRDANHSMFAKQHAVADYLAEKAEELGKLPLHVPGRYRHFKSPGVHVEFYTALNALVQGGVAEYVKDVMLEINRRGYGELLVLQVHDELVFDAPIGMHDEIQQLLDSINADINPFRYPLRWEGKPWRIEL